MGNDKPDSEAKAAEPQTKGATEDEGLTELPNQDAESTTEVDMHKSQASGLESEKIHHVEPNGDDKSGLTQEGHMHNEQNKADGPMRNGDLQKTMNVNDADGQVVKLTKMKQKVEETGSFGEAKDSVTKDNEVHQAEAQKKTNHLHAEQNFEKGNFYRSCGRICGV